MSSAVSVGRHYFIDCSPPYSFFSLVEMLWEGDRPPATIHRFLTLMRKLKAKYFLLEELDTKSAPEFIALKQEIQKKKPNAKVTAKRLTFFCSGKIGIDWSNPTELPNDHLLGYAILATIGTGSGRKKSTYLHEAVVRKSMIVVENQPSKYIFGDITNYYFHCKRKLNLTIGSKRKRRDLKIEGTYFTQQNGISGACAHACLKMAFNSSEKIGKGTLSDARINEILNIDLSKRQDIGLNVNELATAVGRLGYKAHVAEFQAKTSIEYDRYIYPFVESGYPVILGLQGWDISNRTMVSHVVTVIGHTLNTDRWSPEATKGYGGFPARFTHSAAMWVDHYIMSDDNFGMHLTMPTDSVQNFIVPSKNPNLHAVMAIGIVPKGVNADGYSAERVSLMATHNIFKSGLKTLSWGKRSVWLDRLVKEFARRNVVTRTVLSSGKDYVENILQRLGVNSKTLQRGTKKRLSSLENLKYLWITELSIPDVINGNKSKLGDIVIDASSGEQSLEDMTSVVFSWFPGLCFDPKGGFAPWPENGYVPLLRVDDSIPIFEW